MTIRATDFEPAFSAHDLIREPRLVPALGHAARGGIYRNGVKRLTETFLILAAAPVVLPLILLMALVIACDGANPFFAQKRIGQGGRVFRIWKLRTMVADAERQLTTYLEQNSEAREEWARTQKLKSDPRVTWIGRVLRKCSMDELPQLFNVLNGTMSLVGPRPMMVDQAPLYFGKAYHRLRPGITGLWQISARNESEFIARVRYDEVYDRCLSFRNDLGILLRTVKVVLRGTGY
ncbi:sugar transferase [Paracoccus beibuensis]|uniref:sugar transferase n=1 Tax=Paracoccus beibuensis TaxID=547602 RepID=UPI00224050E4|nr:sugar transferase [Paracoccus beibuensis]